MSLDKDYELFQSKYLEDTDNVFEAINTWSKDARALKSQTQGRISNSEALSSALTDTLPKNLNERLSVPRAEYAYVIRYIKESLSQIDDKLVKGSVAQTLNTSMSRKHLVFLYLGNLSEAQKARVRIVSKLIWYNLYSTKGQ